MSNANSFPRTTQQFAGSEYINTIRLLHLKSKHCDISKSPVDKVWVIPKANKRTYLQQKISVQQLKLWHVFKNINTDLTLTLIDPTTANTSTVDIYPGFWPPDALANYLTNQFTQNGLDVNIYYDPYQLRFTFCPAMAISPLSTAQKYLGFPELDTPQLVSVSQFPPVLLKGIQNIHIYSNFTMNNIPVSDYLCSIPVTVPYGEYINFTNYDNSQSSLCLDPDVSYVRLTLRDEDGNQLDYPEELHWEVVLAMQSTVPDGFAPLEA